MEYVLIVYHLEWFEKRSYPGNEIFVSLLKERDIRVKAFMNLVSEVISEFVR